MKLSPMIQLRKEFDICGYFWKAYFRGTNNRVRQANGLVVAPRTKISDLRFDLLNNPMERGVISI